MKLDTGAPTAVPRQRPGSRASCIHNSVIHLTHTHTESVIPDMFIQTKLDLRVETLRALSLPRDPPTPTFYPNIPRSPRVLLNPAEDSILGSELLLGPSGLSASPLCSVLLGLGQFTACSNTVTSGHENIPTANSQIVFMIRCLRR